MLTNHEFFKSEKAFRALLPGKIALTAMRIADGQKIPPREALDRFYFSPTYSQLENESTKCWWESPAELCRDYCASRSLVVR